MTVKIPQNKIWSQNNDGDSLGVLSSSMGIDLSSNVGAARVGHRTVINTDDITDLGIPVAFLTFTDQNAGIQYYWTVAGGYVFRAATTNGYITAFAKDGSSGTPNASGASNTCSSDLSDMVNYGKSYLLLTTKAGVYYFKASTGTWSNPNYDSNADAGGPYVIALTDGTPHMMCVYGDKVYITENNTKIWSLNGTTGFTTTTDTNDVWNTSSSYTFDIANKAWNVTSITHIRDVSDGIWVFTLNQSEAGCWVFKWDGVTANDPNSAYFLPDSFGVMSSVIKGDYPWILDSNGQLLYFNGGTFVNAPNGKLPIDNPKYLKNSLSAVNDRWIHPNGMTVVNGKIRALINNEYEDNGATIEERLPSGVWEYSPENGWTHIIPLSLYTSSVTDYGQNRISRVGALYTAKTASTSATANGTMLIGAQLYSDASATKEVILYDDSNDTLEKYGYFVTAKIFSPNIKESWQTAWLRIKKLLNPTDKVIVKYRTADEVPTEATITWTSSTVITSTADLSDYNVGDEIEILCGKGGGKCAHIVSIAENAGTYTIELDETFTGATSGTAKARFSHWIKSVAFSQQDEDVIQAPIDAKSVWIQLKVCMQFKGKNELNDIIISNDADQTI